MYVRARACVYACVRARVFCTTTTLAALFYRIICVYTPVIITEHYVMFCFNFYAKNLLLINHLFGEIILGGRLNKEMFVRTLFVATVFIGGRNRGWEGCRVTKYMC